jgi:hypothetical protein
VILEYNCRFQPKQKSFAASMGPSLVIMCAVLRWDLGSPYLGAWQLNKVSRSWFLVDCRLQLVFFKSLFNYYRMFLVRVNEIRQPRWSEASKIYATRIQPFTDSHGILKSEVAAVLTMKHKTPSCRDNQTGPTNPPATVNTRH